MAVQPQEAWNMATETLKRLSRCLDMCSFYSQMGDLARWYDASMDLRRNLKSFLTDDEFKLLEAEFAKLPRGWLIRGKVHPLHYNISYKTLDSIYMICNVYMKEKGILMPKTNDPRAAVLNN